MISFSVIMPTYNQAGYIRNAIRSLFDQTYPHWELIIINDGCTDNTEEFICDYLKDERVTYLKNEHNEGLGFSINRALDIAKYDYIAYLPSDDFYYRNHLEVISEKFEEYENAILVYSKFTSELKDSLLDKETSIIHGLPFNLSLQLIQTAHRKTDDRWIERDEWESEDLYMTFWHKLVRNGIVAYCDTTTCQWTIQPDQRYKLISEEYGGHINKFRQHYNINKPLRIKVSDHKFIDEEKIYCDFRKPANTTDDGLKILIVGELSYNPERIVAFEEAGHKLYALWTPTPAYSFNYIGPLPYGHIENLDYNNWEDEIIRIAPDIIYALTNFCAVEIAYAVRRKFPKIPFVWHFKEGPFLCIEHGIFDKLIYLYTKADGNIFLNEQVKKWYERYIPTSEHSLIFDGDLPKQNFFKEEFSTKLSSKADDIHTVIAGRPVGISVEMVKKLAENSIHVHLYLEAYENNHKDKIDALRKVAPNYFHIHYHCDPRDWTREFSQYDYGWLHCFDSKNHGDYDRISWNDLNIPARLSTMMAAGIPTIQKNNEDHIVAMQSYVKKRDCGIFYKDLDDLVSQLKDKSKTKRLNKNVMMHRMESSFDYHLPELIDFFKRIINKKKNV